MHSFRSTLKPRPGPLRSTLSSTLSCAQRPVPPLSSAPRAGSSLRHVAAGADYAEDAEVCDIMFNAPARLPSRARAAAPSAQAMRSQGSPVYGYPGSPPYLGPSPFSPFFAEPAYRPMSPVYEGDASPRWTPEDPCAAPRHAHAGEEARIAADLDRFEAAEAAGDTQTTDAYWQRWNDADMAMAHAQPPAPVPPATPRADKRPRDPDGDVVFDKQQSPEEAVQKRFKAAEVRGDVICLF